MTTPYCGVAVVVFRTRTSLELGFELLSALARKIYARIQSSGGVSGR